MTIIEIVTDKGTYAHVSAEEFGGDFHQSADLVIESFEVDHPDLTIDSVTYIPCVEVVADENLFQANVS